MKLFKQNQEGWYYGHWNESTLQIKYSSKSKIKEEQEHFHKDFAEYYFVIKGQLILQVSKEAVKVGELELLMVNAMEKHRMIKKSEGCEYIIIKEKSYPNNKF